jgi:hypothetical protein
MAHSIASFSLVVLWHCYCGIVNILTEDSRNFDTRRIPLLYDEHWKRFQWRKITLTEMESYGVVRPFSTMISQMIISKERMLLGQWHAVSDILIDRW